MRRHKHLPAIKSMYPAIAKKDAEHGTAVLPKWPKCSIYCHSRLSLWQLEISHRARREIPHATWVMGDIRSFRGRRRGTECWFVVSQDQQFLTHSQGKKEQIDKYLQIYGYGVRKPLGSYWDTFKVLCLLTFIFVLQCFF